ncbi:kinase-like protein [Clavulina sp. PMI_390]|nr:kinase-like protein [Clavulina sp. PMI_390]
MVTQLVHREAITHSQLHHPNVLPFLGVFYETAHSPPVTIVPLVDRGSLQDLTRRHELTDAASLHNILKGATLGIEYLHSRNPPVIHGDIHPGNIMVDDNGQAYLCDFGLSRIQHEVTRTRTTIQEGGKLRFLAPELSTSAAERFRTTSASDIFSLAMTFLATWSGRKPFEEVWNEWEVVSRIVQGQRPKRPAHFSVVLHPNSKAAFWTLLENMWVQDAASRPPSSYVLENLQCVIPNNSERHQLMEAPENIAPNLGGALLFVSNHSGCSSKITGTVDHLT